MDLSNGFLPERRKLLWGINVIPAKELQIFIILFQFSDLFSQHGRKGQGFVLPEGITGAKPQHSHKQCKQQPDSVHLVQPLHLPFQFHQGRSSPDRVMGHIQFRKLLIVNQPVINGIYGILLSQPVQPHCSLPAGGNYSWVPAVPVSCEHITQRLQIPTEGGIAGSCGQSLVHIPSQHIPVGHAAVLPYPIPLLLTAVEGGSFHHGLPSLPADGIRYFSQPVMIRYMVLKLSAVPEGYGIDHEVIVQGIRVQVGGNDNLIFLPPHPPGCFHADGMGLLRSHLTGLEALVAVISNIAAQLAKLPLGGHHCTIRVMLGAVDGADIHLPVCFGVVPHIGQGPGKVIVQILGIRSLVRVFRIVDNVF